MDEEMIFEKINQLLEDTDYPVEISSISDIEDFLNDDDNTEFEQYDAIEKLYNKLMEYSDSDD